ncbi:DUF7564 family protein [Natrialba sp. SSL1]|nr:hypothetical protein [Natrialba sp. SSL1]
MMSYRFHRTGSLCIACGVTYERQQEYHGYYCTDCRPIPAGDNREGKM